MTMISIQNRQKRMWTVPAVYKADGSAAFEFVNIEPGTTALVQADQWDHVSKGNQVIEALLTGRHLVVSRSGKARPDIDDADELDNPAAPEAPSDLTAKDDRVKVDSKVEVKEISLDTPTEGKGRK